MTDYIYSESKEDPPPPVDRLADILDFDANDYDIKFDLFGGRYSQYTGLRPWHSPADAKHRKMRRIIKDGESTFFCDGEEITSAEYGELTGWIDAEVAAIRVEKGQER